MIYEIAIVLCRVKVVFQLQPLAASGRCPQFVQRRRTRRMVLPGLVQTISQLHLREPAIGSIGIRDPGCRHVGIGPVRRAGPIHFLHPPRIIHIVFDDPARGIIDLLQSVVEPPLVAERVRARQPADRMRACLHVPQVIVKVINGRGQAGGAHRVELANVG